MSADPDRPFPRHALTHVGQIALLRRIAQSPIGGENFFKAEIIAGRTGSEQAAPRREFD